MFRATPCLIAALLLLAAPALQAQPIGFETTPAGLTPVDNAPLSTPYTTEGVTLDFDMVVSGLPVDPVFEQVGDYQGDPGFAFVNASLPMPMRDTAAPGFENQLGSWFIRPPALGTSPMMLIITYTSVSGPVTAASGEIWDIDAVDETATERWQVQAFDGSSTLLGTLLSPEGISPTAPLDGQPWTFMFTGLSDIRRIELSFVGTRTSGIGLAFNNFSPVTAIPEPASLVMLCTAMALLGAGSRRRSRQVRTPSAEEGA